LAFTINLFILCDKALLIPTDGNRLSSLYGQQFKSGSWRPQKRHLLPIDANCWLVYLQDTLAAHTSSVVVCPHFVSFFSPRLCYCWFARSAGNLSTRTTLTGYAAALLPIDFQFISFGLAQI